MQWNQILHGHSELRVRDQTSRQMNYSKKRIHRRSTSKLLRSRVQVSITRPFLAITRCPDRCLVVRSHWARNSPPDIAAYIWKSNDPEFSRVVALVKSLRQRCRKIRIHATNTPEMDRLLLQEIRIDQEKKNGDPPAFPLLNWITNSWGNQWNSTQF